MKYLIKHKKEFIITIVLFVMLAYVIYDGFTNGREAQSVIEAVIAIVAWYFNMPTSVEGDASKQILNELKEGRGKVVATVDEPSDSEVE